MLILLNLLWIIPGVIVTVFLSERVRKYLDKRKAKQREN